MQIDVEPMGKPRMTQRDRWAKRTVVVRYFSYCDALREAWGDTVVPARLKLTFYLPMPKSWSKKIRASKMGTPHDQRPDIDNLAKAIMDALCENDSYIYTLHAEKYWSDTGGITIEELESPPLVTE